MSSARLSPAVVLARVDVCLRQNQPEAAMAVLTASGMSCPDARNAWGVCLLRLGQAGQARSVFCDLVFPGNAYAVPESVPLEYRVNYATALLMERNVSVGIDTLRAIPDQGHPEVAALWKAVNQWRRQVGFLGRLGMLIGRCPSVAVPLGPCPGVLRSVTPSQRPAAAAG